MVCLVGNHQHLRTSRGEVFFVTSSAGSRVFELVSASACPCGLPGAIDLFMAFDDDHNGYIEYDEFLRQIFPEEYVKDSGAKALPVLGR